MLPSSCVEGLSYDVQFVSQLHQKEKNSSILAKHESKLTIRYIQKSPTQNNDDEGGGEKQQTVHCLEYSFNVVQTEINNDFQKLPT